MAEKKAKIKKNLYKATESYKLIMTDSGLLTDDQHTALIEGKSVSLDGVPEKQMKYLITNNLISKGE
tara:strand:+ start:190 stop:390 length:201 start_codon:yes stop_codon:yes gene_type:complete